MEKVKISILMAVYNTDFILVKRAIDSILNQSYQNFEFIILDDGSENDIQNKILNYVKQHQDKIIYIRHRNCGQAASINRGILNSVGEFITILDSDDEYKPQHLESCLQEMQDVDLIASTAETVVDKIEDYYVPDKNNLSKLIHVDECILFATLFGRREVFLDTKFHEKYAADAFFYNQASNKFRVKKVDLRTYIYYRNVPNSISATLKRQNSSIKS